MADNGGVLLLDDDQDLREALGDLVGLLTRRPCLALSSLAEMTARRDELFACELAILDINLGPDVPSGLDAFTWLREAGFRGRIAFLTGHARSHPLVARAVALGTAEVLQKPIGMSELRRLLGLSSPGVTP